MYVDLHCDTLTLTNPAPSFYDKKGAQARLKELSLGGCILQCYALFERESWQKTLGYLSAFWKAKENIQKAGVTPVLTVEGGAGATDVSRLAVLHSYGVKLFGAVWNEENDFGFPNGKRGGLKSKGRETFEYLLPLGVLPDISHLSDEGAEEVFSLCKRFSRPVIATHSLCRALCDSPRNLTDSQIKKTADSGGVIGVCFYPPFIGSAGLLKHIEHLINEGGEDAVAIGSDFDGMGGAGVISRAREMPNLFFSMQKAGFSTRLIEKIAYRNAMRVLS